MPAGSGPSFPPPRSLFTVRLLVVDVVVSQTSGRCGQLHEGCRGELQAGEHMCTNTHTHSEVTSLWLLKTHSGPHSCWNNAVCSSVQGQSRPITTLSEGQAPPLAVTSREPRVEWSREHHGSSWGDSVPGSRARKEVSFFSYVFPPFFFLPSFLPSFYTFLSSLSSTLRRSQFIPSCFSSCAEFSLRRLSALPHLQLQDWLAWAGSLCPPQSCDSTA